MWHHDMDWGGFGPGFAPWLPGFVGLMLLLALWSIVWKGLALWHSAKRGDLWWFVALLVINTAGILEIVYLFYFAKKKFGELFMRH